MTGTGLLDEAEKLAAGQEEYLARLRTLRREMWQPLLRAADRFSSEEKAIAEWTAYMPETAEAPVIDGDLSDPAWKQAEAVTLIPMKRDVPVKVRTTVRSLRDRDHFYFGFDCEYPDTVNTLERSPDDPEIWKDAGVEIFLSPDKKLDRCYQIMVNASGSIADLFFRQATKDWSWNSQAEAKSVITPGRGWTTEIRIPRSSMEPASGAGMLANFTRLYNPTGKKAQSYVWGPFYLKGNNEITHFGTLRFQPDGRVNLIEDGDFDAEPNGHASHILGKWFCRVNEDFPVTTDHLVAGRCAALLDSARIGEKHEACSVSQYLPLKPGTEYELSFFARLENVKPAGAKASGFYVRVDDRSKKAMMFPHRSSAAFSGSMPWTPMFFRFRTSPNDDGKKPRVAFTLRKATGKVWIDHVRLYEVKAPEK